MQVESSSKKGSTREHTSKKKLDSERSSMKKKDPFTRDWHEMKPDMTYVYTHPDNHSRKIFSVFYEMYLKGLIEFYSNDSYYCKGCQTFVWTDFEPMSDQSHPVEDLVHTKVYLDSKGIVDEETFYEWAITELKCEKMPYTIQMGEFSYRFPGLNRYHFTYSALTGESYLDWTLSGEPDQEKIRLELMISMRDHYIEKIRVNLFNSLILLKKKTVDEMIELI